MKLTALIAAALAAVAIAAAPTGHAARNPLVSPGMVILVTTDEGVKRCTLGYPATDLTGRLWALTAGHCGVAGAPVYNDRNQPIGRYVAVVDDDVHTERYGYALIALEEHVTVSPYITNLLAIEEQGEAATNDLVCFYGTTTGRQCSAVLSVTDDAVRATRSLVDHGDSGGPVMRQFDNALVGIVIGYNDLLDVTLIEPADTLTRRIHTDTGIAGLVPLTGPAPW